LLQRSNGVDSIHREQQSRGRAHEDLQDVRVS